ncbi:MAG: zinc-binding alcohol dehydrogenase family protein [Armatimonadetes bacterium]|nr:zinc-binding alcohol dehydrogenase family protein [Armatimonadota bacterium]
MKTVTLEQPGQFALTETDAPTNAPDGHALVRVRRVGICGTDLHAFRGRQPFFTYPRILGHELGVEVLEVGPNAHGIKAGDRCAVEPYLNCGACIACRRGKPNCCANLKVLGVHTDGGMREVIAVPVNKLHRSEKLSLDQLALVETLGIGAHAVARAQPEAGEFALIVGAGPIGLSVLVFALIAGARPLVMDVNESRLAFVRRHYPVEEIVTAGEGAGERLKAITSGDMPTLVFDATGHSGSMHDSFGYVAPGGKLVYVGLFQGDVTFHDPDFHRRELTILSSRNATPDDFRRILGLMEEGKIDTEPWISERVPCEAMVERFPLWTEPGREALKSIVTF